MWSPSHWQFMTESSNHIWIEPFGIFFLNKQVLTWLRFADFTTECDLTSLTNSYSLPKKIALAREILGMSYDSLCVIKESKSSDTLCNAQSGVEISPRRRVKPSFLYLNRGKTNEHWACWSLLIWSFQLHVWLALITGEWTSSGSRFSSMRNCALPPNLCVTLNPRRQFKLLEKGTGSMIFHQKCFAVDAHWIDMWIPMASSCFSEQGHL